MQRLWLAISLLALVLAACGAPQPHTVPTPTTQQGSVVISFAAWQSEHSRYRPLANRFMKEHPGITVVLVAIEDIADTIDFSDPAIDPNVQLAQLRRIVSGADTATTVVLPVEAFGTPLLLDLKPLMDADATFRRDDFFPGTIERYEAKDGIWALPYQQHVAMIRYNRTLFQNTGVPEPRSGWTWSDLLAVAEQMTRTGSAATPIHGVYASDSSGAFALSLLLGILSDQGVDVSRLAFTTTDLTAPEYVAAIERIRDMYRRGVLIERTPPNPSANNPSSPSDIGRSIREGHVAMWSDNEFIPNDDGTPWMPDFPTGIASWPSPNVFSTIYSIFSDQSGFIISGGTRHPEAAWRWIEWLSRQPDLTPSVAAGMGSALLPARQSVAQQMAFWKTLDPQSVEAYRGALANSGKTTERSLGLESLATLGILGQTLYLAISDPQSDVRETLARLQTEVRTSFEQVQQPATTATPDLSPVVVATAVAPQRPAGAVTIRFGSDFPLAEDVMGRLIRMFNEQHPDIVIEPVVFEWTPDIGVVTSERLAQIYDCFQWSDSGVLDDTTALLDLRPLLDADPLIAQDDFFPGVLDIYGKDGRIYGLPYLVQTRSIIYDHAAFRGAGIEPPRIDWTPDEFLAAAQALTTGDGDQRRWGYVPLYAPDNPDLLFFVNWQGARLTTGVGNDLRPNYTDPKTIAAIRWYLELSTVHRVAPPLQFSYRRDARASVDYQELTLSGRGAMWLGQWTPPIDKEGNPFDIRHAPLPVSRTGVPLHELWASGLFISAETQHQQACWTWIRFLSGNPVLLANTYLPARRSVAESEAFLQQPPIAVPGVSDQWYRSRIEAMRAMLNASVQSSGSLTRSDYRRHFDFYWLFKALSAVVEQGANLEQELAEAQRVTTAYVECMNQPNSKPATCAKQVDPAYEGLN